MLLRITTPYFVAGVVVETVVTEAAPIVKYMIGWTAEAVCSYCQKKGWKIESINMHNNS